MPSPGHGEKASRFWAARRQRGAALTAVLWNEEAGVWLDYHFLHQRHNPAFYLSNISPLWAECDVDLPRAEKVLCYLEVRGSQWLARDGCCLDSWWGAAEAGIPQFTCTDPGSFLGEPP